MVGFLYLGLIVLFAVAAINPAALLRWQRRQENPSTRFTTLMSPPEPDYDPTFLKWRRLFGIIGFIVLVCGLWLFVALARR